MAVNRCQFPLYSTVQSTLIWWTGILFVFVGFFLFIIMLMMLSIYCFHLLASSGQMKKQVKVLFYFYCLKPAKLSQFYLLESKIALRFIPHSFIHSVFGVINLWNRMKWSLRLKNKPHVCKYPQHNIALYTYWGPFHWFNRSVDGSFVRSTQLKSKKEQWTRKKIKKKTL